MPAQGALITAKVGDVKPDILLCGFGEEPLWSRIGNLITASEEVGEIGKSCLLVSKESGSVPAKFQIENEFDF